MDFLHRYGPWALVTGASSGIGEQFAHQLAARGLNLLITARRESRLQTLSDQLGAQYGVEVKYLALDLANPSDTEHLVGVAADMDLGLVVSNAGFGLKGLHGDQDPQQLQNMLLTNVAAPLLLSNALARQLSERGRGGFLLTGSIEAFLPFPYSAAYAASKAFVSSLAEALACEWRPAGIDVMVLCPGSTDTEAIDHQGVDRSKLKGLMTPSEVARQALDELGHRTVFIPGTGNRWLVRILGWLPRKMAINAVAQGMRASLRG